MRKLLFLSHGKMAEGILNTLSIFSANIDNTVAICGYVDDSDPKNELDKFFSSVSDEDVVVVFTDLMGGSVNQYAIPYLQRPNTFIFAGMNFPLVLQVALSSEDSTIEDYRLMVESSKDALVFVNDYQFESFSEDDE